MGGNMGGGGEGGGEPGFGYPQVSGVAAAPQAPADTLQRTGWPGQCRRWWAWCGLPGPCTVRFLGGGAWRLVVLPVRVPTFVTYWQKPDGGSRAQHGPQLPREQRAQLHPW